MVVNYFLHTQAWHRLHGTYEKRIHISLTFTISSGVALLFLKNKQLNRLIQE